MLRNLTSSCVVTSYSYLTSSDVHWLLRHSFSACFDVFFVSMADSVLVLCVQVRPSVTRYFFRWNDVRQASICIGLDLKKAENRKQFMQG